MTTSNNKILLSQDLGIRLHEWHSSMYDPIYQVGSCAFAKVPVELDLIKDCLNNLRLNKKYLLNKIEVSTSLNKTNKNVNQDAADLECISHLINDLIKEVGTELLEES